MSSHSHTQQKPGRGARTCRGDGMSTFRTNRNTRRPTISSSASSKKQAQPQWLVELESETLPRWSPGVSSVAQKHGLRLVVLFGSRAVGRAHAHSDIDIGALPINSKSFDSLNFFCDVSEVIGGG